MSYLPHLVYSELRCITDSLRCAHSLGVRFFVHSNGLLYCVSHADSVDRRFDRAVLVGSIDGFFNFDSANHGSEMAHPAMEDISEATF